MKAAPNALASCAEAPKELESSVYVRDGGRAKLELYYDMTSEHLLLTAGEGSGGML